MSQNNLSSPQRRLNEDVTSMALDAAGFLPGIGEAFDFANAVRHAKKGEYFQAAMSALSMLPEVGDVIGKTAKYAAKSNRTFAQFVARYGDNIVKNWWPKLIKYVEASKELAPYAQKLDQIIARIKWQKQQQNQQQQNQRYEDLQYARNLQQRAQDWMMKAVGTMPARRAGITNMDQMHTGRAF